MDFDHEATGAPESHRGTSALQEQLEYLGDPELSGNGDGGEGHTTAAGETPDGENEHESDNLDDAVLDDIVVDDIEEFDLGSGPGGEEEEDEATEHGPVRLAGLLGPGRGSSWTVALSIGVALLLLAVLAIGVVRHFHHGPGVGSQPAGSEPAGSRPAVVSVVESCRILDSVGALNTAGVSPQRLAATLAGDSALIVRLGSAPAPLGPEAVALESVLSADTRILAHVGYSAQRLVPAQINLLRHYGGQAAATGASIRSWGSTYCVAATGRG